MTELLLTVTPSAVNHIRKQILKRGSGLGLVLGTKTTGCSGLAYTMEYADVLPSDQPALDFDGLVITTDKKTAVLLQGATLDFVRKGLNEGFTFENPNEKDRCGCGESFRV